MRIDRLRPSAFWRQVMTLSLGAILAQGAGLASVVVLPRLFSDESIGSLGVLVSTLTILAVAINGGLELAVMLPDEEEGARALTWTSIGIAGVLTALTGLIGWWVSPLLSQWLGPSAYVSLVWLPLSLLLEGLSQPLRTWLNRHQAYRLLSLSRGARSVVTLLVSLGTGWAGWGTAGLVLGWVTGQVAALLPLLAGTTGLAQPPSRAAAWQWVKRYGDFPRYAVVSSWLNTLARFLPVYVLLPAFGAGLTGQFVQADRILSLPAALVGMAVGGVFYEKARHAWAHAPETLETLTRQTARQLTWLGLGPLVALVVAGPQLFAWVLGPGWTEAGTFAQVLAPWFYLVFIASPLSYLIDVRRQLPAFLWFNLVQLLLRAAALWAGTGSGDALVAVALFSLAGVGVSGAQLVWTLRLGKAPLPDAQ